MRLFFLIHPTHRKYIKLLRDSIRNGYQLVFTDEDCRDFKQLMRSTKNRGKRHRGIYRLTLRAKNRPISELEKEENKYVITERAIKSIEKQFAKVEWQTLGDTLKGAFVFSLLKVFVKRKKIKK